MLLLGRGARHAAHGGRAAQPPQPRLQRGGARAAGVRLHHGRREDELRPLEAGRGRVEAGTLQPAQGGHAQVLGDVTREKYFLIVIG